MIFDYKTFFETYQKDYHCVKAHMLKRMMDDIEKYSNDFFGSDMDEESKKSINWTLKSDLRQTCFHAIETMFELIFAFEPLDDNLNEDIKVLKRLSFSNWRKNNSRIEEIADSNKGLDFLDRRVVFDGKEISIGHFIFYKCFTKRNKSIPNILKKIDISLDEIKKFLKIAAQEYAERDEYNAYKHSMRPIYSTSSFQVINPKTGQELINWDLKDSMSFFVKPDDDCEIKIKTKVFDPLRDYNLTIICSNLIYNMVFFRRIYLRLDADKDKHEEFQVYLFEKGYTHAYTKMNVSSQNHVFKIHKS